MGCHVLDNLSDGLEEDHTASVRKLRSRGQGVKWEDCTMEMARFSE